MQSSFHIIWNRQGNTPVDIIPCKGNYNILFGYLVDGNNIYLAFIIVRFDVFDRKNFNFQCKRCCFGVVLP